MRLSSSGILKHKSPESTPSHEAIPDSVTRRSVTFDEQEIAAHDKQRGGYPKIDEPKTPFHYKEGENQMSSEEKKQKLQEINDALMEELHKVKYSDEEDHQDQDEEWEKKRKEFEEKRKNHYKNEFGPVLKSGEL